MSAKIGQTIRARQYLVMSISTKDVLSHHVDHGLHIVRDPALQTKGPCLGTKDDIFCHVKVTYVSKSGSLKTEETVPMAVYGQNITILVRLSKFN